MATNNSGGAIPIAFALVGIGAVMMYSGFKNLSVVDLFAGEKPPAPDPSPVTAPPDALDRSQAANPTPDEIKITSQFKGPNALKLGAITLYGMTRYKLKVTQICRPQNATYGAAKSKHKECRAVDMSGTPANMAAFAREAHKQGFQVFYDPIGLVAPGFSHVDHVHVGDPD